MRRLLLVLLSAAPLSCAEATTCPPPPLCPPPQLVAPLMPLPAQVPPAPAGIRVDLPTYADLDHPVTTLTVDIDREGRIAVDGQPIVTNEALVARARAAAAAPEARALLRADLRVPFEHVIRAMDLLKQGGVPRFLFSVRPVGSP